MGSAAEGGQKTAGPLTARGDVLRHRVWAPGPLWAGTLVISLSVPCPSPAPGRVGRVGLEGGRDFSVCAFLLPLNQAKMSALHSISLFKRVPKGRKGSATGCKARCGPGGVLQGCCGSGQALHCEERGCLFPTGTDIGCAGLRGSGAGWAARGGGGLAAAGVASHRHTRRLWCSCCSPPRGCSSARGCSSSTRAQWRPASGPWPWWVSALGAPGRLPTVDTLSLSAPVPCS